MTFHHPLFYVNLSTSYPDALDPRPNETTHEEHPSAACHRHADVPKTRPYLVSKNEDASGCGVSEADPLHSPSRVAQRRDSHRRTHAASYSDVSVLGSWVKLALSYWSAHPRSCQSLELSNDRRELCSSSENPSSVLISLDLELYAGAGDTESRNEV